MAATFGWAYRVVALVAVVVALSAPCLSAASSQSSPSPAPPKAPKPLTPSERQIEGKLSPQQRQAVQALGAMPVLFVENKGQWDAKIRYAITGRAVNIALMDSAVKFQLVKPRVESTDTASAPGRPRAESTDARSARVRARMESTDAKNPAMDVLTFSLTFEGAKVVQPRGTDEAASKIRYYTGSDQSKWQNAVPTFKSAVYEGLYEGVDLKVRPGQSGLKYEFHVAPKASVDGIVMKYEGVEGLSIDSSGNLRIKTAFGELGDAAPSAWQESAGARKDVKISFRIITDRSYGFEIKGPVDATGPLVIDPGIAWKGPHPCPSPIGRGVIW